MTKGEINKVKEEVKVSVVVPVYGTEKYLRKCLDSILNQTLKQLEVIVVDDGSPDDSPVIIDEYVVKDSRVIPIHKKNAGVSAARNDGIAKASGKYVFLCDSDDWMEISALEKMVELAEKTDADVVVADHYSHRDGKRFYSKAFDGSNGFVTDKEADIDMIQGACLLYGKLTVQSKLCTTISNLGAPWQHLYRKSIIEEKKLKYNTGLRGIADDISFNLQYYQYVTKAAYYAEPIYNYCLLSGSLTKSYKPNLFEIYSNVFSNLSNLIRDNSRKMDLSPMYVARSVIYLDRMMEYYFVNSQNPNKKIAKKEYLKFVKGTPYSDYVCKAECSGFVQERIRLSVFLLKHRMYSAYWLLKDKGYFVF